MANSYPVGSKVRSTCTFENSAGTDVDPTGVSVTYRVPGAAASVTKTYPTDAEVVKSATGIYYIDLDLDTAGEYRIRWAGTGSNKAAQESRIRCAPSFFS